MSKQHLSPQTSGFEASSAGLDRARENPTDGEGRFRPPDPASQPPVSGRRAEQPNRDSGPVLVQMPVREHQGSSDVSLRTTRPSPAPVRPSEARTIHGGEASYLSGCVANHLGHMGETSQAPPRRSSRRPTDEPARTYLRVSSRRPTPTPHNTAVPTSDPCRLACKAAKQLGPNRTASTRRGALQSFACHERLRA